MTTCSSIATITPATYCGHRMSWWASLTGTRHALDLRTSMLHTAVSEIFWEIPPVRPTIVMQGDSYWARLPWIIMEPVNLLSTSWAASSSAHSADLSASMEVRSGRCHPPNGSTRSRTNTIAPGAGKTAVARAARRRGHAVASMPPLPSPHRR